jgi:hypothetical protein
MVFAAMFGQGCGALIGIEDVPPATNGDASPGHTGGSQGSGGSPGSGGTGGGDGGTGGTPAGGSGGGGSGGTSEEEGGMATGGGAGSDVLDAGPDASPALLQFQVGTASPTPPNPDDYGTQADSATHQYTLKNIGGSKTSAIMLGISGNQAWEIIYRSGDCEHGVTQLPPGESCNVTVMFNAGKQNPGDYYTATLAASATAGGSTTNDIKGKIARFWALQYNGALIGTDVKGLVLGADMTGVPCNDAVYTTFRREMFAVPNGIQVLLECNDFTSCTGRTYCRAPNTTAVRQCGTTTTLGTYWEADAGCAAAGVSGTYWASPNVDQTCDTSLVHLVTEYSCR